MSAWGKKLEQLVRSRARNCCEYCHLPQFASRLTFPIDHVVARQHGGKGVASNLALCCSRCNLYKGPNLSGKDPRTNKLARLFDPRRDRWADHFRYSRAVLVGLTDVGRTTIFVLKTNHDESLAERSALIKAGEFPRFK